jgi:ABC-type enterochelin transport system permease subunit
VYLLSDIELYEHIDTRFLIVTIYEFFLMEMIDILDMADPVVHDAIWLFSESCLDPTTTIVSTDYDMLDT